jgi:hypothetical protein
MFMAGVLTALSVVHVHGADTLFDEIVKTCGKDTLIQEARRSGNMEISGMADYVRKKKQGL